MLTYRQVAPCCGQRCLFVLLHAGAWACAAAKLVARNCKLSSEGTGEFAETVRMWVHEEQIGDQKLTDIINETHENVKYLPGVNIGDNVVACPDLLVLLCPCTFHHI